MPSFDSPFLAVPANEWLCSNDLTFAIFDQFPVSPGHGSPHFLVPLPALVPPRGLEVAQ